MKKDVKVLLRGVGVGLIVAATFFYGISFNLKGTGTNEQEISQEVIIEKARDLGMVFITEPMKQEIDGEIDLKP